MSFQESIRRFIGLPIIELTEHQRRRVDRESTRLNSIILSTEAMQARLDAGKGGRVLRWWVGVNRRFIDRRVTLNVPRRLGR